jgi:hypothetical protein
MGTLRSRLVALLTMLSALLSLGWAGQGRYFCPMRDRVVDACCCPGAGTVAPTVTPRAAQLESRATVPDCCVRLSSSAALGVAIPREATRAVATPALLAMFPAIEVRARLDVEAPGVPFAQVAPASRSERRLFLEHCALLI